VVKLMLVFHFAHFQFSHHCSHQKKNLSFRPCPISHRCQRRSLLRLLVNLLQKEKLIGTRPPSPITFPSFNWRILSWPRNWPLQTCCPIAQ
jgi:hypothetical protein